MAKDDVEMIDTHAVQAHIDAFSHSLGGEIEMLQISRVAYRMLGRQRLLFMAAQLSKCTKEMLIGIL